MNLIVLLNITMYTIKNVSFNEHNGEAIRPLLVFMQLNSSFSVGSLDGQELIFPNGIVYIHAT